MNRLDVRPSVTRWYCIKTAERIVIISLPHDSPFILVLCISISLWNSDGVTPYGAAKHRWSIKMSQFSTNNSLYLFSETVEDRWVHAARRLTSIASSFQPCGIYRDCPSGVPRGKQNVVKKRSFAHENCLKPVTRYQYLAISQKWLKIDRYTCCEAFDKHWILFRSMWTFTAIVPGAYPGEAKTCKNVLKLRTLDFTALITGKRLKIDGYMLRGVWPALNSLSIHVKFTAIVPGAYPGKAKCVLIVQVALRES